MPSGAESKFAGGAEPFAEGSDLVTPVPFYKNMVPLVSDRWCGNSVPGGEATLWINGKGVPSVRTELNRGTRVWLYENCAGELVGFGSLGVTVWEIGGQEVAIQFIPMLGVFVEHQGLPRQPPKYCYQIVDHLIDEAEARAARYPLLGLSVYHDNLNAIHVYEAAGFAKAQATEGYNRMVMGLGA